MVTHGALRTSRLDLVPAGVQHLSAELDGPPALAAALGVRVSDEWPPELYGPAEVEFSLVQVQHTPPEDRCWLFYYLVLRGGEDGLPTAVGIGGFKGPPEAGEVELGYSVLPAYRGRGLATEAVGGLVARAFSDERVQRVVAETYPELTGSIRVLERSGFRLLGAGTEEGTLRYALGRADWSAAARRGEEEGTG